jgi:hypothetical protein
MTPCFASGARRGNVATVQLYHVCRNCLVRCKSLADGCFASTWP